LTYSLLKFSGFFSGEVYRRRSTVLSSVVLQVLWSTSTSQYWSIGSSSEELMSTQPGQKIIMLPVNNRDVLSKYFGMGHTIRRIVFMRESAIVSWVGRKATRRLNK
jgi:hypothetical protein